MTAEVINLRRARKAKARRAKEAQAGDNRRKFGVPKQTRQKAEAEASRSARAFEGHRREPK